MVEIIKRYVEGESAKSLCKECGIGYGKFKRVLDDAGVIMRNLSESKILYDEINKGKIKHSEETKMKISKSRKEYLSANPDKHVWKRNDKYISKPCENFKLVLEQSGMPFVAEYSGFGDKNYSIDIAFPEYKIGIEINGNQHYESDGQLKEYYKVRHEFIESFGWQVFELHYSLCFNNAAMMQIVKNMFANKHIFDFDYDQYLKNKLAKKVYYCSCGGEKSIKSILCRSCSSANRRKSIRPDMDVLKEKIRENGYRSVAKEFGISDTALRKWLL